MHDLSGRLLQEAWKVRERAHVIGPTKVGCAVLSDTGQMHIGCNVEHRYRSHDVHAEVNAITSMVTAGDNQIVAVAIAAERDRFTPCGACMDWIFQFADPETCEVFCQAVPKGPVVRYRLRDLMPYYPR
jgi:cytidine deaminase